MKTLARIGAVLSFTFFFIPGTWLVLDANAEKGVVALGLILFGIACFAGTLLWLVGEKCGANQAAQPASDTSGGNDRSGRTVTIALLLILVVGGAGMALLRTLRTQADRAEATRAPVANTQAPVEEEPQK